MQALNIEQDESVLITENSGGQYCQNTFNEKELSAHISNAFETSGITRSPINNKN
jgi:hypothetical protein